MHAARAKWRSFEMMKHYFYTYVRCLERCGIVRWNDDYNEDDKDERGVPKQPIAFWRVGEEWRAISFDETRLDDATHGDGGNRKGKSERIVICGPLDRGEAGTRLYSFHPCSQ
jgi:hypothetical protein